MKWKMGGICGPLFNRVWSVSQQKTNLFVIIALLKLMMFLYFMAVLLIWDEKLFEGIAVAVL